MGLTLAGRFTQAASNHIACPQAKLRRLAEEAKHRDVLLALEPAPELPSACGWKCSAAAAVVHQTARYPIELSLNGNYISQDSYLQVILDLPADRAALVSFSDLYDPETFPQLSSSSDVGVPRLEDVF
jgi:hypothetical protein